MMIKRKKLILSSLLFFCFFVFQAQNIDNQLRISPSLSYKFSKKWEAEIDYRYALDNDFATFRNSMVQGALQYNFTKKIGLETGYRFTTSFERDHHTLFINFKYNFELSKRWELKTRTRFQYRTEYFDADFQQNFREPRQFFRERLLLAYNVKKIKLTLFVAPEIFIRLEDGALDFHRMRYYFGGDYKLKYGNTIGLSAFFEDRIDPRRSDRMVWNMKYNLDINELLKKIKKDKKKKQKKANS